MTAKRAALTILVTALFSADGPSSGEAPNFAPTRDIGLVSIGRTTKPTFVLDSLGGAPVDLAGQTNRIVLVHFFATWCEPCRDELSALQRLARDFAQHPFTVLAIDVGEVEMRVRRFFDALPVTFPVLLDRDKAVSRSWGLSALPTTFVLDRTLTARFVVEGDVNWDRPDIRTPLCDLMDIGSTGDEAQLDRQPCSGGRDDAR